MDADAGLSDEEVVRRALLAFAIINENEYVAGVRETSRGARHEFPPCECSFEPGKDPITKACGADCINRAIFIECIKKYCPCGDYCTNRRWAPAVSFSFSLRPRSDSRRRSTRASS